jgi:hypothetical protein
MTIVIYRKIQFSRKAQPGRAGTEGRSCLHRAGKSEIRSSRIQPRMDTDFGAAKRRKRHRPSPVEPEPKGGVVGTGLGNPKSDQSKSELLAEGDQPKSESNLGWARRGKTETEEWRNEQIEDEDEKEDEDENIRIQD